MKDLESLRERVSEKDQKTLEGLITSSNALLDTVKHAIILLQVIIFVWRFQVSIFKMARNKIDIPPSNEEDTFKHSKKEEKENVQVYILLPMLYHAIVQVYPRLLETGPNQQKSSEDLKVPLNSPRPAISYAS